MPIFDSAQKWNISKALSSSTSLKLLLQSYNFKGPQSSEIKRRTEFSSGWYGCTETLSTPSNFCSVFGKINKQIPFGKDGNVSRMGTCINFQISVLRKEGLRQICFFFFSPSRFQHFQGELFFCFVCMFSFFSLFFFFFLFFGLFRAIPMAYEGSQARGLIGATVAGLHQSPTATQVPSCICNLHHSSRQHWILNPLSWARPGIEPASSWILVRLISSEPRWELLKGSFYGKYFYKFCFWNNMTVFHN